MQSCIILMQLAFALAPLPPPHNYHPNSQLIRGYKFNVDVTVILRDYWMVNRRLVFLSVVWFSSSLPPPPPPHLYLFLSLPEWSPAELTDGWGGRGWERSQIIRQRESLVLCKSFNTLWLFSSSAIPFWSECRLCNVQMTKKRFLAMNNSNVLLSPALVSN